LRAHGADLCGVDSCVRAFIALTAADRAVVLECF